MFNMNMGWNNKNICMHCEMKLNEYIQFPYNLNNLPRRSMDSFVAHLKPAPDGEKCHHTCRFGSMCEEFACKCSAIGVVML